ncbi:acyltransferase family protein [Ornithinimicrobium pekingense]|uniref:Acyltransferase n=1 Tax=Ornithinimicrobium pekingense TaxID=384677 RepID=A0ABQ2FCC1_9MICO|nr:acyltransferase family protein [Ornithinimicrobium pekingense]GGK73633.1 acyltransferase [Ornithinimicrobium pekingense]
MSATPSSAATSTASAREGDVPLTRARLRALRAARHALHVPPVPRDFRTDIEGMRAIAVFGVMLWHAGVPLLPGGFVGVDVFFVVSGFLMTALLLEEARARGRIDLGRFYARRARRLLPAALTALLGTALLTVTLIPRTRWGEIGGDLLASAGYLVNWRLADRAVDYLDLDRAPSPVQHYWSLAVEEQFYVLWPVLLLLLLLVARGRARVFVGWSWGLTLAALAVSLVLSAWWTEQNASQAYFVTPTRVHELMLGAVVALGARRWPRVPRVPAAALGWVGLAMIVTALVVIDASTPFPGTAALLPTVGTALVIVSGFAAAGWGPDVVLRARPLQWTGRISYSLYLWHWPFVAAAASLSRVGSGGPDQLPVHWGVLAVVVSVVPAWLSFRYVEEPVRVRGRVLARRLPQGVVTQRTLRLGLNCTLAGLLAGLGLMAVAPGTGTSGPVAWRTPPVVEELRAPVGAGTLAAAEAADGRSGPGDLGRAPVTAIADGVAGGVRLGSDDELDGTAALADGSDSGSALGSGAQRVPAPDIPERIGTLAIPLEQVRDDLPVLEPEGCFVGITGTEVGVCEAGDPEGDVTVALTGDSHAGMWVTALDEIGRERGWRVLVLAKSSCPPAPGVPLPRSGQPDGYTQCADYQRDVGPRLLELDPDVVLMSSASYSRVDADELAAAMASQVDGLRAAGIVPALIRDVPRPPFDVPECLVSNPDAVAECAFPRADALERAGSGQPELLELRPALPVVDLNDAICPAQTCSPVVGGVVVWRDSNHLSATYVDSLRELVEEQVSPIVTTARMPEPARSPLLEGERIGRS